MCDFELFDNSKLILGFEADLILLIGVTEIISMIAFFYYASVMRAMWMRPNPDGDTRPVKIPPSLSAAMALCAIGVIAVGVYPSLFTELVDLASLSR